MIPKIIQLSDLRTLHWRSKMPAGGAPPIVFLHGVGDGADIWRTVVSEWPGGLMTDAYAFDLPGHGGSSRMAAEDYQVKNVATMIAETLKANNIK